MTHPKDTASKLADYEAIKKPRDAVLRQLLGYCHDVKRIGCYFGNEKQYWKRHSEIVEWLNELYSKP